MSSINLEVLIPSVIVALTVLYLASLTAFAWYKRNYYNTALKTAATKVRFWVENVVVELYDETGSSTHNERRFYAEIAGKEPLCLTTNQKRVTAYAKEVISRGFPVAHT